jgi:hypothetical protein
MELGSLPTVRLFLTVTEEYAQGVQTLCYPHTKREGSSRRSRTPSGGEEFADVFPEELLGMPPKKGIGVYHRPETGDRTDSKNALSDVDPGVARVGNAIEGVVGPRTDTS